VTRTGPPRADRPGDRALRALGDPRARPNVSWIRALTGTSSTAIRAALREIDGRATLEASIRARHREGGRPSYAQIRAPFDLYAMARLLRPGHVVETGVSSGVSSAHFQMALRRNRRGWLHSIDLPTRQRGAVLGRRESPVSLPPGFGTGWAMPAPLRTGWDLRIGPSQELLPRLVDELPSVDLFLHDSLHTPAHLAFELETIRPKLTRGSIVLADNTVWTGASFPRFAASLGVPVRRRGRSDLVGLRVP
jgi:predicted O-methyltransferase YrrM